MLTIEFDGFPNLETERLVLRQVRAEDAADLFALRTNEGAMKYLDRPRLKDMDEAHEFIRKIEKDYDENNGINWMITLKDEDRVIGNIGFWRFDKANYRIEIGYMLMPQYWGKGIATEAMDPVLQYAFETLKVHSIEANVNPENEASKRLLMKIGFRQEAYFRENYYYDGRFLDSAIFCLLEGDLKFG